MNTLAIDIETYSSNDLTKCGVYKYVEAEDFTILLIAYSYNGGDVQIIETGISKGEAIDDFISLLRDPSILKTAYNANFERTCLSAFFRINLPADQWECTMIKAAMSGLPLALDQVAKVLKLDQQKSASGKQLIRYFSLPCKPTKANGMRTRNLPMHDPFRWNGFKEYCMQDVVVEQAIRKRLQAIEIPQRERQLWALDQRINDTGILVDRTLIDNAIRMDEDIRERLTREAFELTGLSNPNSATQLKDWLSDETGKDVEKLTKDAIPDLLKVTDCEVVSRVLNIRKEMAKTSVKKYAAMQEAVCEDNRVRGLLQFYGANRTGRWAGRLVQVQNLPQNRLNDLDLARDLVRSGDIDMVEMLFGNIPDTLSQLIRTAFVAPEGYTFAIADFSAIEARVIAWLAGEQWRLDVFNSHGKIYEASAAQMFGVPIESITKGSPLRQKGKVAELALGYQGGVNAMINMGALKQGLTEGELPGLVNAWRNANPAIVRLWRVVENAAKDAVAGLPKQIMHGLKFYVEDKILFAELPSGRRLSYVNPRLKSGSFGGDSLCYDGMDQMTKQWKPVDTYGGKLVENLIQAIARDCLAEAMLNLHDAGYKIVMHVHDEVVCEVPQYELKLEEINAIMGKPIAWAPGLHLTADSYSSRFYKKD